MSENFWYRPPLPLFSGQLSPIIYRTTTIFSVKSTPSKSCCQKVPIVGNPIRPSVHLMPKNNTTITFSVTDLSKWFYISITCGIKRGQAVWEGLGLRVFDNLRTNCFCSAGGTPSRPIFALDYTSKGTKTYCRFTHWIKRPDRKKVLYLIMR